MDGFKEFQNKNLDAAIQEACSYYNAAREKLEIEIVQDAKSGIFGIVGALGQDPCAPCRSARSRGERPRQEALRCPAGTAVPGP